MLAAWGARQKFLNRRLTVLSRVETISTVPRTFPRHFRPRNYTSLIRLVYVLDVATLLPRSAFSAPLPFSSDSVNPFQ